MNKDYINRQAHVEWRRLETHTELQETTDVKSRRNCLLQGKAHQLAIYANAHP